MRLLSRLRQGWPFGGRLGGAGASASGRASAVGAGASAGVGAAAGNGDYQVFPVEMTADQAADSLLSTLPAAVVVDFQGAVRYISEGAQALGLVVAGRLQAAEVMAVADAVRQDGRRRVRQVRVLAGRSVADAVTGSGGRPAAGTRTGRSGGSRVPAVPADLSGERWLRVTAQLAGPARVLILIDDMTDEYRFQRQRRDFITNVAHELKTPTGAIGLLAETIGGATDDPQAVAYFAGRIGIESERLSALVGRLIELERIESGGDLDDLGRETDFDAGQLVAGTVDEVRQNLAALQGVELRLSVQGVEPGGGVVVGSATTVRAEGRAGSVDRAEAGAAVRSGLGSTVDLTVRGRADLLHSAVRNLVENAVNYSSSGSSVQVFVGRQSDRVVIRVLDQGIGIPVEAQSRIFERFYRVDEARQVSTGGSGIGLSIVKHAVEHLGGQVSVWSKPGEGSTFTVELPAVSAVEAVVLEQSGHSEEGGAS